MTQEQEKKIESMMYEITDLLKDEFSSFFFDTIAYGYAEITELATISAVSSPFFSRINSM